MKPTISSYNHATNVVWIKFIRPNIIIVIANIVFIGYRESVEDVLQDSGMKNTFKTIILYASKMMITLMDNASVQKIFS